MNTRNQFLLILCYFVISGCSFQVKNVPDAEEFYKSIEEILIDYPEMNKVFKSSSEHSEMGMAFLDPFLEKWGEPVSTELSWWNLWPGNWPFFPQELWVWELADKKIRCRIDHPIYEGFNKTICNCIELKE